MEQLYSADLNSIGFVKHKHQLSKDNTQMDGSIERESKGEAKIIFIDNTEEKHSCAGWQDCQASAIIYRVLEFMAIIN